MSNTTISPTVGAVTLAGVAFAMALALSPPGTLLNFAGNAPSVSPVTAVTQIEESGAVATVTWSGLLNGFIGTASRARAYQNVSIQAYGTFGSGGSVKVQGSNDGVDWGDVSAAPLTASTGAGFFAALTALPRHLRPNCTAGDSTTSLTVVARFT